MSKNGETNSVIATLTLEEIALNAISPIDGRYAGETKDLSQCFSEYAVMRYRILVEIATFIHLLTKGPEKIRRDIDSQVFLKFYSDFTMHDALRIKEIESTVRHDVKSVEYFLREKFDEHGFTDLKPFIHYGTTSEDVDSFARVLAIRDSLARVVVRVMEDVISSVFNLSRTHMGTLMLARTHGQAALPTTFGKEMKVFWERFDFARKSLVNSFLPVKWNGAVGTRASLMFAHPGFNWTVFANELTKQIENYEEHISDYHVPKLIRSRTTTQIAHPEPITAFLDALKRFNGVGLDFSQAIWQYISDGWLVQLKVGGEVGSSTMPQKVNPIDFENAEGNFKIANMLLAGLSEKLQTSRLQRDLSNSTMMRNFGVAIAHCLLAYKSLRKGLKKIRADEEAMRKVLEAHPEILVEGIQIVLRREGVQDAYEILKDFSRGEKVTMESLRNLIRTLPVSDAVKEELADLNFDKYVGFAAGNVKNKLKKVE